MAQKWQMVIVAAVVLAVLIGAYLYLGNRKTAAPAGGAQSFGGEIGGQILNPGGQLPETNPFEAVKTNPFEGVYQNPFGE